MRDSETLEAFLTFVRHVQPPEDGPAQCTAPRHVLVNKFLSQRLPASLSGHPLGSFGRDAA